MDLPDETVVIPLDKQQNVLDTLDTLGISYERIEHPPVHTIEEMDDLGIFTAGMVCKNLFLRNANGKTHYVVCLPKDKQVDIQKDIRAALGCSRLSFGSDERLQRKLALSPGAVSPFGIVNNEEHDVVVVLDKDLKRFDGLIGFHPNVNTAFVWLKFDDLMTFIQAMGNPVCCIEL